MIARHERSAEDKNNIWAQLAAPLPAGVISWRQDGRPMQRDGKYFARFVAYIEANTVRERLDAVVPGEWDLTLELLPTMAQDEPDSDTACAFKARLQALGVVREDVGHGKDYKQAATDAFKRAAVRFGIGHELYAYEQNWVRVDGDGKYAKPLEDPGEAYARRTARGNVGSSPTGADTTGTPDAPSSNGKTPQPPAASPKNDNSGPLATDEPSCPKCGGRVWDNRLSKKNPKAPDFKCRDKSCDGVIWPPKATGRASVASSAPSIDDRAPLDEPYEDDNRSLPF